MILELPSYDSDKLSDDSKPRDLTHKPKAVFPWPPDCLWPFIGARTEKRAREEKRIRTTPHRRFRLPAKRKDRAKIPRNKSTVDSAERRSRLAPIGPGQPLGRTFAFSFSPQGLFELRLSKPNAYRLRRCPLSVSSLSSHCGQWGSGRVHSLPASVKNVAFACSSSVPHLRQ
jgi:hypothetical protein